MDREPSGLRVAHVGRYRPASHKGVDVAFSSMVEGLGALQVDVEVWHLTHHVADIRRTDHSWGSVFEIPSYRGRIRSVLHLPSVSRRFLEAHAETVDVLHLHSVFTPENLQVSRLGAPFVVSPHGGYRRRVMSGSHRTLKALWMTLLERPYLDRAGAILVNSPVEATEFAETEVSAPVLVIPNGVSDDLLQTEMSPPASGAVWLFLGRLDVETKGLDLLVEGYARLVHDGRREVPDLVIAGPDHRGGRAFLNKLCRDRGIEARVRFPGPVAGAVKRELMDSCSLFVLLSRNEGMPLSLLEALALGRPVVVSPGTNMSHLIEEHSAGWTAGPDVGSVRRALLSASEATDDHLNRLGENARSLAHARFRWSQIIPELVSAYRDLSRERKELSGADHNQASE